MKTLRLPDDAAGIEKAGAILKQGGIVAIPTETVYGLAASAFDDAAIGKVFAAKGRPQDNPLIVHIADLAEIIPLVENFPPSAKRLAERFWPGPLTMVLRRTDAVANSVSAGLSTVAVRMPSDPVARQIIKAAGLPLAAPSANLSGSPSPTTANHVLADLDGRIDAVVLSHDSGVGVESTVVSLAGEHPRLLRPGGITVEQLRELLPDLEIDQAVLSKLKEGQAAASPGMKYKHYAPKTQVVLVEADSGAFCDYVNRQEDCGAICFEEDVKNLRCKALCYGACADAKQQANRIFDLLRKADGLAVGKIFIHAPSKEGIGLAVYNRLIRAAAFQVIHLNQKVLGLTGPTGAGKSTACQAAADKGVFVIDCDQTARRATEDDACLRALCEAFGGDIRNSDGTLDRAALADKAFSSREQTALLNQTIFPFILDILKKEIRDCGSAYVLLDAPTLFESGADRLCDDTCAILAEEQSRLQRILARDGLNEERAKLRMRAGKDDAYYLRHARHIIYNNKGEEELYRAFSALLDQWIGGNYA